VERPQTSGFPFSGVTTTMSGPIVRKYGFPNFDKIFGERPLQHGADEPEQTEGDTALASEPSQKTVTPTAKKSSPSKKKRT
jgi:hypothetical protein